MLEGRLLIKHYKKWDDLVPSLFIHRTKHTYAQEMLQHDPVWSSLR
jgi:hypothetical protein